MNNDKELVQQIHRNTQKFYHGKAGLVRHDNFLARVYAFLVKKRLVWPRPSQEQINVYNSVNRRSKHNQEKRRLKNERLRKPRRT